jgi:hypothetical protein
MPSFGPEAASNSFPSAEEAKDVQSSAGPLFDVQDAPKFVEVFKKLYYPTVASVEPSAELAIALPKGALFVGDHVTPQLVER